jgi:hypothetical protein
MTSKAEMSPARTMAFIILILVIGPVMYLVARGLALAKGFDKVQVGDTSAVVMTAMGKPAEEARTGLYMQGDTEYRYTVWPLPKVWVVSLKNGKVLEKGTR